MTFFKMFGQSNDAILETAEYIKFLCDTLPQDTELMGLDTGECLSTNELSRVLGILTGIATVDTWMVVD